MKQVFPTCPDKNPKCTFKVGVYVCAMEHQAVDDDGRIERKFTCPHINYDG